MSCLLPAGCDRPRAPELQTGEHVYRNPEEGVQFQPPKGWFQRGLSGDPEEAAPTERMLVKYKWASKGKIAFLRVSKMDLPPGTSLTECLEKRPPGGDSWERVGKTETYRVQNYPAARVTYRGPWDNQQYLREVVAVQRASSVLFLVATYPPDDAASRRQVRELIDNLSLDPDKTQAASR